VCWSLMTQSDRKKGHHTDYVKRQYIGNGQSENGIVAVTAYESSRALRFLCSSRSTNPGRLKPADIYRSKPEIAAGMIRELKAMGFRFKLVRIHGESGCGFINVLYELKLDFVVAIRSNHASGCRVSKRFTAIDGASLSACSAMVKLASLYSREIFGKRRTQQYWELTTDPETLPKNATWCVMTHIESQKV